jgi:hypothetical protein
MLCLNCVKSTGLCTALSDLSPGSLMIYPRSGSQGVIPAPGHLRDCVRKAHSWVPHTITKLRVGSAIRGFPSKPSASVLLTPKKGGARPRPASSAPRQGGGEERFPTQAKPHSFAAPRPKAEAHGWDLGGAPNGARGKSRDSRATEAGVALHPSSSSSR